MKDIESLVQLQYLSCEYNQLTDLKEIESLTNLHILSCFGNQLSSLKEIENLTNLKENILGFKYSFNIEQYRWVYRKLCFALIDDKMRIFQFPDEVHNYLKLEMFLMNSNKALKITINLDSESLFMENIYEIIEDDKYRFDDTIEKKDYIKNLLTNTDLDLSKTLNHIKSEIGHLEVKLPNSKGDFITKTLKEIYETE